MTPEDIQQRRITPDTEFLDRFPDAREAVVYEFDSEGDAEMAKATLLSTAIIANRRGRVLRVPWKTRQRVLAMSGI